MTRAEKIRTAVAAALFSALVVAWLLFVTGCNSTAVKFTRPPRFEHATAAAALDAAWKAAGRLGLNYTVSRVNGYTGSMYPHYGEAYYAVFENTNDWHRAPGRLVIRRLSGYGNLVCHAAGPADALGVITYGTANAVTDYGRANAATLVGIVVETHHFPTRPKK